MEASPKGQIGDCANGAEYFHKGFDIQIGQEHLKPEQEQYGVKLDVTKGVAKALQVVSTCIKNFKIEIESIKEQEITKESQLLIDETQKRIIEIQSEFGSTEQTQELDKYEALEDETIKIFDKLNRDEFVRDFCFQNYIQLIGDYLSIDKQEIEKFITQPIRQGSFVEQIKQMEATIRDLQEKVVRNKKIAKSIINLSTEDDLKRVYEGITGKKLFKGNKRELKLDLKAKEDSEFMEAVCGNILPKFAYMRVYNMHENLRLSKDFIFSGIPKGLKRIDLNPRGEMLSFEKINDIVMYLSSLVSRNLYILNADINYSQMRNLFQIGKEAPISLGFVKGRLQLDSVPDLEDTLIASKLEGLNLESCGIPERCDWVNHPERFSRLIEGLSQSNEMKNNLKLIFLLKGGMTREHVRELLDKFGFENVKIYNHSI